MIEAESEEGRIYVNRIHFNREVLQMKRMLIVYYTWSNGNTERIAKMLQKETGGDLVRIDTVIPYTGSYDDVVNQGQDEVQRGYEPEIKLLMQVPDNPEAHNPIDGCNLADYDVIAVGTPTWWYTMAPAVRTFLHQNDFSGKTVVPFMTNGGWPGHVIKDMQKACKGATACCSMQIQFDSTGGSRLQTPTAEIESWIKEVKEIL
jgi:flavodoxin